MKLDRNINADGQGKYALLKLRTLRQIEDTDPDKREAIREAISLLDRNGLLHWGHESPGEQFFVMKYQDAFTSPALTSYAKAALRAASARQDASLREYAHEMFTEAAKAELFNRIPD